MEAMEAQDMLDMPLRKLKFCLVAETVNTNMALVNLVTPYTALKYSKNDLNLSEKNTT